MTNRATTASQEGYVFGSWSSSKERLLRAWPISSGKSVCTGQNY